MSQVSDAARVSVLLADYALADVTGKLNAIGAFFDMTALDANTGMTPQQTLAVIVTVPVRYAEIVFDLCVELIRFDTGGVATFPAMPGAEPQALRVVQQTMCNKPMVPAGVVVPDGARARANSVLGFSQGLQLPPGITYSWRVSIDGATRPDWETSFSIAAPLPLPVVGGPTEPVEPNFPSG